MEPSKPGRTVGRTSAWKAEIDKLDRQGAVESPYQADLCSADRTIAIIPDGEAAPVSSGGRRSRHHATTEPAGEIAMNTAPLLRTRVRTLGTRAITIIIKATFITPVLDK